MEKIVTIKLKDSSTEEEFQAELGEMTEEEYIEICQTQLKDILEVCSSKVESVDVKIVDTGTLIRKNTRIYKD